MRILALIPGSIGDQILFFPTLETLKHRYPKAAIDVLVEPGSKSAYRVCPHIHDVLIFDYKDRNGLADYLNLLGIIRDREYDIALNLGRNWTIEFLLWLDGIPVRVGYKSNTSWFIDRRVLLKTEQYAAHMYHDLVKGLDIQTPCPEVKISLPKEDIDWAEATQKTLNIKDSGYILIHDGSSKLAKIQGINQIYPIPKWQLIVEDIQRRQSELPVVLLKTPEGGEWTSEMLAVCPDLKVVSPPDIGKLAATIAGANLMLCTDSLPMHLSVAVGTYTVALFGPREAKKLLPPESDRFIGLQSLSKAIADIPSEQVLEKIWRV